MYFELSVHTDKHIIYCTSTEKMALLITAQKSLHEARSVLAGHYSRTMPPVGGFTQFFTYHPILDAYDYILKNLYFFTASVRGPSLHEALD